MVVAPPRPGRMPTAHPSRTPATRSPITERLTTARSLGYKIPARCRFATEVLSQALWEHASMQADPPPGKRTG